MKSENKKNEKVYTIEKMQSHLNCNDCTHCKRDENGNFICELQSVRENTMHNPESYHACITPKQELMEEAIITAMQMYQKNAESKNPKKTIDGIKYIKEIILGVPRKEISVKYDLFTEQGRNSLATRIKKALIYLPDTKATAALCKYLFDERTGGMAYTPQNEKYFFEYRKKLAVRNLAAKKEGKTIIFDGEHYLVLDNEDGKMLIMAETPFELHPMKRPDGSSTETAQEICYYWLSNRPELAKRAITEARLLFKREYDRKSIREKINLFSGSFWLNPQEEMEDCYVVTQEGNVDIRGVYSKNVSVRPVLWISPDDAMIKEAELTAEDDIRNYRIEYEKEQEAEKLNTAIQEPDIVSLQLRKLAEKEKHFMQNNTLNDFEKKILLNAIISEMEEIQQAGNLGNTINILAKHLGMTARV